MLAKQTLPEEWMASTTPKALNETTDLERANKVFKYLLTLYPLYRRENNTEAKAKGEINKWGEAISNLADKEIRRALVWCRDHEEYAPTVARFKFKAYGLVDTERAYEVANAAHECVAVRKAYTSISSFEFQHSTEDQLRKRFLVKYRLYCDEIVSGHEVSAPIMTAIEQKEEEPAKVIPKEEINQCATESLAKIKDMLDKVIANKLVNRGVR